MIQVEEYRRVAKPTAVNRAFYALQLFTFETMTVNRGKCNAIHSVSTPPRNLCKNTTHSFTTRRTIHLLKALRQIPSIGQRGHAHHITTVTTQVLRPLSLKTRLFLSTTTVYIPHVTRVRQHTRCQRLYADDTTGPRTQRLYPRNSLENHGNDDEFYGPQVYAPRRKARTLKCVRTHSRSTKHLRTDARNICEPP